MNQLKMLLKFLACGHGVPGIDVVSECGEPIELAQF